MDEQTFNKLKQVNDYVNWTFPYKKDDERDIWKTPKEFESDGCGDCDDKAIYKFFKLWKEFKPRLYYCEIISSYERHMVLVVDNMVLDLVDYIVSCEERKDLLPIYGFDQDHIYICDKDWKDKAVLPNKHMSKWNRILNEVRSETS